MRNSNVMRIFFCLALLFISTTAYSQTHSREHNPYLFDVAEQAKRISWLPGEQFDILTGTMNHSMVDLHFKGNGIPIEIHRSIRQGGGTRANISTPTIALGSFQPGKGGPVSCADRSRIRGNIYFTYGDTREVFLAREELGASITHFPSDVSFISKNSWVIKCNGERFEVYSTDGMIYRFAYTILTNSSTPTIYTANYEKQHAYQIQDKFGSTLTLEYEGYTSPKRIPKDNEDDEWSRGTMVGLKKIQANDGRIVNLTYEYIYRPDRPNDEAYREKVVKRIQTNGSPNKRTIDYENSYYSGYTVSHGPDKKYSYLINSAGMLLQTRYPQGGVVNYEYGHPNTQRFTSEYTKSYGQNRYKPLIERQVNAGDGDAVWTFKHHFVQGKANSFARVIHSPSHTVEYRFRKKDYDQHLDSGYLYQIKQFNDVQSTWNENAQAHLETSIIYTDVFDQCSELFRDGNDENGRNIKETRILHRLRAANGSSIQFETRNDWNLYGECDPYYNKLRTLWYAADTSLQRANYSYKNTGFGYRWIKGAVETLTTNTGDKTVNEYNENGSIKRTTANGIQTDYVYVGFGAPHKVTTGGETYTTQSYYRGIPRQEIDQSGRQKNRTVSSDGTVRTETTWGLGGEFTYTYDSQHRLTKTEFPNGIRSNMEYSYGQNFVKQYTANLDYLSESRSDGFGYPIFDAVRSSMPGQSNQWRTTKYDYDTEGRLRFQSYPSPHHSANIGDASKFPGTQFIHDGIGRVIEERALLAKNASTGVETIRTRKWNYTIDNGLESVIHTDGKNVRSHSSFVSYGAPKYQYIIKTQDGNGNVTSYNRDTGGRIYETIRDGKKRSYAYNWKKQIKSITSTEDGLTSFAYNSDGTLRWRKNNGRTTSYLYYPDNQVQRETAMDPSGTVTTRYYYDDMGLLSSTQKLSPDSDLSINTAHGYDLLGNLLYEKTSSPNTLTLQLSYDYDDLGNLKAIQYPNGNRYELDPNAFGEPEQTVADDGTSIVSSINYRASGQYHNIYSNSNRILSSTDQSYHVRDRRNYGAGNSIAKRFSYAYSAESELRWLKDQSSGKSQNMYYDNGGRLLSVTGSRLGLWAISYNSHDDITKMTGNGFTQTYNYDANRRLKNITSIHPTRSIDHNAHGEVTGLHTYENNSPSNLRFLNIERDALGHVVKTGNGTKYAYDSRGMRFFKDNNGRIYSLYDRAGKLRYRYDPKMRVESEYFYVSGELIAKREISEDGGTGEGTGNTEQNGITVSGLTISWPDNGWYQVQNANSLAQVCEGGTSCTVDGVGDYIVINHTLDIRTPITVSESGSGSTGSGSAGTPPSAPGNVQATASGNVVSVSYSSVTGADKYNIYFNNNYLTTVTGNTSTSYTHNNVATGSHTYYIVAIDNEKNEGSRYSAKSASATVNVGSGSTDSGNTNTPPDAPTGVNASASGNNVVVSWTGVTGADKYNVYFNNTYRTTVTGSTTYTHSAVSTGTHTYYIVAIDNDKIEGKRYSAKSDNASVVVGSSESGTSNANTAPNPPSNVSAIANGTTVNLTWSSVAGADKYNVYFNNTYRTTVTGNSSTSYSHTGVSAGTHSYYVVSIDNDKNSSYQYSAKSASASVTVDSGSTSSSANAPTNFRGTVYSQTALQLDWTKPNDAAHGGAATAFEIYKNNALLLTTTNGSSFWLSSGLSAGQTNTFHIVAVYPDGSKSSKAGPISLQMNQ